MARIAPTLFALAFAGAGCLGDFVRPMDDAGTGADAGAAPGDGGDEAHARFISDVKPILDANCAGCHNQEGAAGPAFLKPIMYDTLTATPGMVTATPSESLLVTKGKHEGPAFTTGQAAIVLQWLTVEAAKLPPDMGSSVTTQPMPLKMGANKVDLGALAPGLTGDSLTFDLSLIGSTLELSNITVDASGAHGVHVAHPLFIVVSGGKQEPDPVDSFASLDLKVAQGNMTALGPGTLFLDGVGALDQLAIAFHTLEAYNADGSGLDGGVDNGGGGGCKAVPAFTADTQPTLAQRCVGCHGGSNTLATNAVDMTRVGDLSGGGQATACAQVKTKVNTATPSASGIFAVTDPKGNANHPFKFNGDSTAWNAFVQAATQWINSEK